MQDTITIPKEIRLTLDDIATKEGISPDDLVNEVIKEYLFFRRFRLLRENMITKAQKQGIFTDQDVFNLVS